ncbi:hypothetical protein D3C74_357300 [compost metagenome]
MDWKEMNEYISKLPKNDARSIYLDGNYEKSVETVNEILSLTSLRMTEEDLLFLIHAWIEMKRERYSGMKIYIRTSPEIINHVEDQLKVKKAYCRIQFAEVTT